MHTPGGRTHSRELFSTSATFFSAYMHLHMHRDVVLDACPTIRSLATCVLVGLRRLELRPEHASCAAAAPDHSALAGAWPASTRVAGPSEPSPITPLTPLPPPPSAPPYASTSTHWQFLDGSYAYATATLTVNLDWSSWRFKVNSFGMSPLTSDRHYHHPPSRPQASPPHHRALTPVLLPSHSPPPLHPSLSLLQKPK
jgi:hypothetical protein